MAVGGVGWFMATWREHPDHIAALRPRVADRFSLPFGMPIAVTALIGIIAVSISRIFLAVSKNSATVAALIIALVIFGAGFVIASRPKLDRRFLTGLIVVALAAVVTLGIVGAAKGERDFEHHGTETEHATEAGATEAEVETGAAVPGASAEAEHTAETDAAGEHATETTAAK